MPLAGHSTKARAGRLFFDRDLGDVAAPFFSAFRAAGNCFGCSPLHGKSVAIAAVFPASSDAEGILVIRCPRPSLLLVRSMVVMGACLAARIVMRQPRGLGAAQFQCGFETSFALRTYVRQPPAAATDAITAFFRVCAAQWPSSRHNPPFSLG
jgi:hypothetical protein